VTFDVNPFGVQVVDYYQVSDLYIGGDGRSPETMKRCSEWSRETAPSWQKEERRSGALAQRAMNPWWHSPFETL